jgi:photosystem II stability/assembly factor-like uncharacterized protein
MKQFAILFSALLLVTSAMAQWVPQNSETTKNLNSIFFTHKLPGYIAGDSGVILKTLNGGTTWDTLSSRTTAYLTI